ncbi:FAD/NAD-P-binding domain-containing protein [Cyathus striatus]|nr:FAD/NAD-P-binding domain-containing protein [Cyathus striatus]
MSKPKVRETVVVVGGGGAGAPTVRELSARLDPDRFNLILITARPFYIHLPACIRMAVTADGRLENRSLMPYDQNFVKGNGKLVIGKVVSIARSEDEDKPGGYVTLENGEKIDYSVLVLTPGSIWEGPLSFPDKKPDVLKWLADWRKKFEDAQEILLVGGGAIGIEYAGEIKDIWPHKKVTIVHGDKLLLNKAYPSSWRRTLTKRVRKMGVEVILDDFVDTLEPVDGVITTRSGHVITTDFVVPCRGGRPNTEFVETLGPGAVVEGSRVKVTPTLQLFKYPRVFAGGDVIDWYEQKQVAKYYTHASIIARNVVALLDKKHPPAIYTGKYEVMVLTMGKNGGASYFEALWGLRFGDWFSTVIKSRGLFVGMARAKMGLH